MPDKNANRVPGYPAVVAGRHRVLATALLCAAGFAGWFINRDVTQYLTLDPKIFTDYYWTRRFGLLLHVGGGSVALTTGVVQLWLGLTGRTRRLHRLLGRVYVIGVLCGASAGLYMAATIPPPGGFYASGLVGLEIAWIITTSIAYLSIRRGAVDLHRKWMIRSYVVTFGFVVLRVVVSVMTMFNVGTDDSRYGLAAWLCWTLPLLLTFVYFRINSSKYAA